jgi:DnaJ-domain-containing protein 1
MRLLAAPKAHYVEVRRDGVVCRQTPLFASGDERARPLDVQPADVLEELRRTHRRIQVAPFAQLLGLPAAAGALYLALVERNPVLAVLFGLVGAGGVLACYLFLRELDKRRCTTRLVYEMDQDMTHRFAELRQGFSRFASCRGVWYVPHGSSHPERAKEIGATAPLHRYRVKPALSLPSRVQSNLQVPTLHAGRLSYYFFPDRIYVYAAHRVSVIAYDEITAQAIRYHYMEEDEVPSDARIAGSTWRHVHPDGTKDLHVHNNHQVPIVIYGELRLTGPKSLDALYQCSQAETVSPFASSIAAMTARGEERYAAAAAEAEAEEAEREDEEPEVDLGSDDPRFDEALAIAVSAGYASSALFVQRMQIRFERASVLVATMEADGYVEPARGTEPRLVRQSARRCVELLERMAGEKGSGDAEEGSSRKQASASGARTGRASNAYRAGRATREAGRAAHDVLGVDASATGDEIAAAYHQLAQLYHPDKVATLAPEFTVIAERRMREINAAYRELTRGVGAWPRGRV